MNLAHTVQLNLTIPDNSLDKMVYILERVVAIIMLLSLVYQLLRPVVLFASDFVQSVGIVVRIGMIAFKSVRYAL